MVVCCSIFVAATYTLPAQAQSFPSLQDSKNPALQKALIEGLEKLSLTKAVANNRLAVTVVDITDLSKPQMAEVNGSMMMYSASLPKIAILLGAMQKVDDGDLNLTPAFEQQLTNMIRHSSNPDASSVYDLVGPPYLANLLQSDPLQLYKKNTCLLYTSPSPRDATLSRMPSSA